MVIREHNPKAKKTYSCDASDWLREALGDINFTFAEWKAIAKAKRNGWRIMPGEVYFRQVQTDSGEIFVVRAIPELHEICVKYNLYEDA